MVSKYPSFWDRPLELQPRGGLAILNLQMRLWITPRAKISIRILPEEVFP
jgi:hypothetical protein